MGEYIALSAFHWEFFFYEQLRYYVSAAFLFWPISTLGFHLSDFSFTLAKRGHKAFRIAELGKEIIIKIDLKIRVVAEERNRKALWMWSVYEK